MRHLVRGFLLVLLAVSAGLAGAAPAWAHAALLETTPGNGTIVAQAPDAVRLRFDEQVGVALGSVRVLTPDGSRADLGTVERAAGGSEVVVPLRAGLGSGTYVVLWRVVSADSHPVSGASSFSIGHASTPASAAPGASSGEGRLAAYLLGAARWLTFTGLVLLVGGGVFLLRLWPAGLAARRARRLLGAGWTAALTGAVGGLLLQGPYAAGLGVSHALDRRLLADVLHIRYGQAAAARIALLLLVLLVVALPLVRARAGGGPGRLRQALAAVLALSLLGTVAASGHPAVGELRAVALPADVLHLAAVSTWLGGLCVLALGLLSSSARPASSGAELLSVLPRWSRLAATSVAVLVATGLFAAWREVREYGALGATSYGRLLLVKSALVLLMLLAANAGRRWVSAHAARRTPLPDAAGPTAEVVGVLRRGVLLEAGAGLAVLAVTAVLVQTPPARSAYSPSFHGVREVSSTLLVTVDVEPARTGVDQLHVYYTGIGGTVGGQAQDVPEVTARFLAPTGDQVPVAAPRKSLGHYEQLRVPLPVAGSWRLEITTRTSDVDATTTVFPLRIR